LRGKTNPDARGAKDATRNRKKRWNYGELEIDDILDAAARIVRHHGVQALTMRGLANELGISAMSAYHYVSDKRQLLQLLVDRMLLPIRMPSGQSWRERIRKIYVIAYQQNIKYPGLLIQAHQHYRRGGEGARVTAEITSVLENAGFDHDVVQAWELAITHYLIGFVQWEVSLREHKTLSTEQFLKHFEEGLDIALDGLEKRRSKNR
jgi:AcrR family transcriptional regulator